MPDGDKIHNKLSWRYQQPYQDICERKSDRNDIVWTLKRSLLLDIKNHYGDKPVKYAKRLGEMLQEAIESVGQNDSVDWAALGQKIRKKAQHIELQHYEKGLLLRACQGIIHEFRHNQRIDTSYLPEAVVERLFQEIYRSNFEERIPLTPTHYAGIDHTTVMEYLDEISPDIFTEISKWAKKATVDEDVKNLQRSRREKVKQIELNEEDMQ